MKSEVQKPRKKRVSRRPKAAIPLERVCAVLFSGGLNGSAPISEKRREGAKAEEYLDAAGFMIVVLGADERVSLINKKGCEILGATRDEIVGKNWFDTFLPPWSREVVRAGFQRLISGEAPSMEYFENPIVTPRGEEKMIAWRNSPLRGSSGRIIGTLSSGEDISDRKKAEEALGKYRDYLEELVQERTADYMASEEKYRTLVENVPLVVYRTGPGGEILFVNRFAEAVLGYPPDEIYSRPELWKERVYPADRVRVESQREERLREGKDFFAEYRVQHKDGHIVYVSDHAIPLRDRNGEISSVDGIILDVSQRVELEEKLVQAKGIKTVTEVSARLAHEIRNPLASAGGFARRLLSAMDPKNPDREKMQIIVSEVGRLESILRMILNYLQPLDLEFEPTDPNTLVENALREMEAAIQGRKIRLDLQLASQIPLISADRFKMEMALQSLLRKAISQMPEGEVLSISVFPRNKTCKIAISYPVDEVLPGDLEHFFYPFITPRMGYDTWELPAAQILVHKHGGLIEVKFLEPDRIRIEISLPLLPTLVPSQN